MQASFLLRLCMYVCQHIHIVQIYTLRYHDNMLYCINSTTIVQVRCTHYKIIFWWWIELVPSLATLIIKLCREHYCLHVLYLSVYKMIIFTVASACLTLYRLIHHVIIKIGILISYQNTGIIAIYKKQHHWYIYVEIVWKLNIIRTVMLHIASAKTQMKIG